MLFRSFGVSISIAIFCWPSSSLGLGEINVESTTGIENDTSAIAVAATDLPVDLPLLEALKALEALDDAETGNPDKPTMALRREYGPTIGGNSLWRVANNIATTNRDLSIYQWMHGIWRINPRAFTQANMHQLKVDELVLVPFEREVKEISHSEAYRTYVKHRALLQPATQISETAPLPDEAVELTMVVMETKPIAEETAVTTVAVIIDTVDTSSVADPSITSADLILNEGDVVLDMPESSFARNQSEFIVDTTLPGFEAPATAVAENSGSESQTLFYASPLPGDDLVEQSPLTDSGASFTNSGLSLPKTDKLTSTNLYWFITAAGGLVILLLFRLRTVSRPRPVPVAKPKQEVSEPVPGVSIEDGSMEDDTRPAIETGQGESSGPGRDYADIDEIIKQADGFKATGKSDEAIKLLVKALEQQPDQARLKIRLLEAYHLAGEAALFKTLVKQYKTEIAKLDTGKQIQLQAMYSGLCLDPSSPRDTSYLANPDVMTGKSLPLQNNPESTDENDILDITLKGNPGNAIENNKAEIDEDPGPYDVELAGSNDEPIDTLDFYLLDDDATEEPGEISAISTSVTEDLDEADEQTPEVTANETPQAISAKPVSDALEDNISEFNIEKTDPNVKEYGSSDEEYDLSAAPVPDEEELTFSSLEDEMVAEETEQLEAAASEDEVDSNATVITDIRLLHFSESRRDDEKSREFESELRLTIQALRDQLQQMNERLFRQERDSSNLRKEIGELRETNKFQPQEKNKKEK